MFVLTIDLGPWLLAFDPEQVNAVIPWKSDAATPGGALGKLLDPGAEGHPTCPVALMHRHLRGNFAFGIPMMPRQIDAPTERFVRVPRVLSKLGAPRWLAGFVEVGDALALRVDLRPLAEQLSAAPEAGAPG